MTRTRRVVEESRSRGVEGSKSAPRLLAYSTFGPAGILFLAGGSDGTRVYGAERSVLDLVAGLDRARYHPCCAVTQGEGPYVDALRSLGVPTVNLRLRAAGGRLTPGALLSTASGVRRLLAVARRARADLIHVNALKVNHYAVLTGWALGVPVVCHLQGHVAPRAYFTRLAFGAGRIVACSEAVAAPWLNRAGSNGRLRVVYYGLDPDLYSFSDENRATERARLGLAEDVFALGVVSRLSPSKKLKVLFRALASPACGGRVLALVAGDAPPYWRDYAKTIRELPRRLGIERRVVFLGYVDNVSSLYSAFDAVVAPSNVEGLGRVILEAMAAERPVIAVRAGGPVEVVVHGETGLLVPPEDPAALASAILNLAGDRALCARLGKAGRRRVEEKFSLPSYVRAFEGIYRELLGGPSEPGAARGPAVSQKQGVGHAL